MRCDIQLISFLYEIKNLALEHSHNISLQEIQMKPSVQKFRSFTLAYKFFFFFFFLLFIGTEILDGDTIFSRQLKTAGGTFLRREGKIRQ